MVLSPFYNVIMVLFIGNSKMSYQLGQLGQTLVLPGILTSTAFSRGPVLSPSRVCLPRRSEPVLMTSLACKPCGGPPMKGG